MFHTTISQVGVRILEEGVQEGYTLIHPQDSEISYLIDNNGRIVNTWSGNAISGKSLYLLENGLLLRTLTSNDSFLNGGGVGGLIQLVKWDGTIYWQYLNSFAGDKRQHHDVQYLPNGNILMLEWAYKTKEDAILNGRNPSTFTELYSEFWSEQITEYKITPPNRVEIVWQWDLWDHLVQDFDPTKLNYGDVSEKPYRLDLNYRGDYNPQLPPDWLHANSISYNEDLDQIILSSPYLNEFYVIDHSTTTEEAATGSGGNSGMGGDILYRWGNPFAYKRGEISDQKLFGQHTVIWANEGDEVKVLLFNNGRQRPAGNFSTIEFIHLPYNTEAMNYNLAETLPFEPESAEIRYIAPTPTDFFSIQLSGAQIQPNGNFLICEGSKGKIFEVNDANEIVWTFVNPIRVDGQLCIENVETALQGAVFRAEKYPLNYNGLPQVAAPTNKFYWEADCLVSSSQNDLVEAVWPNPFQNLMNIIGTSPMKSVSLFDLAGKKLSQHSTEGDGFYILFILFQLPTLPQGQYVLRVEGQDGRTDHRLVWRK